LQDEFLDLLLDLKALTLPVLEGKAYDFLAISVQAGVEIL